MVAETVAELLEPCAADAPCGDDLEYDPDFLALETAAKAEPDREMGDTIVPGRKPDWADVEKRARALLARTKHLGVAMHWTRARLTTRGLPGFAEGCVLVRELLDRYWDDVHPRLDPDDGNDPTSRVTALAAFNDEDGILPDLRRAPLAVSRVFGAVSYRDLAIAAGELEPVSGDTDQTPDAATLEAIFADCDTDAVRKVVAAVAEARSATQAIEEAFVDRFGVEQAPEFDKLSALLKGIAHKLDQRLGADSDAAVETPAGTGLGGDAAPAAGAAAAAPSGQVRNRDDVVKMIDKICDYYAKNEPASPVPMLLKRARRLVPMTYMEIMRDLTPDGVSQAEMFRGGEETEE